MTSRTTDLAPRWLRRAGVPLMTALAAACTTPQRWSSDVLGQQVDRHAEATNVCTSDTPALTPPDSLGPLRPGMTLADLEAVCDGLEYRWLPLEGTQQPVVLTRLGEVSILVEVADTLPASPIQRVSTPSPRARTPDGVGPGVPLASVLERWRDVRIAFGEGTFGLSESHPGISLELSVPEGVDWRAFDRAQRSGDLGGLPEGTAVSVVLLTQWVTRDAP